MEDIRDVEIGETYFILADQDRDGRCVCEGMFTAIWRTKAAAKSASDGNLKLKVVRQVRV